MADQFRARLLALKLITIAISLMVALGLMETALRIDPGLIGIAALSRFESHMRGEIAARLGLPTMETVIRITPDMRTDGGQPILLPGANSLTVTFADAADLALGAVQNVQVDQNGFCNDQTEAIESRADILVAGDSFTYCTAVTAADTASHRLQELSGLRTYNLGIRGTGPYEYLEMLKRHAPAFHPRVAVMNIYEGNDLRDVIRSKLYMTTKKSRRHDDYGGQPAWSYAVQFIKANAELLVKKAKLLLFERGDHNFRYSAMAGGQRIAMNVTNGDQDEVDNALQLQDGKVSLDEFAEPLSAFIQWANSSGIRPIVTYIPSMYTAYGETVEFEDSEVGAAVQGMSAAQRQWFAAHTAALKVPFIDITPAFQRAAAAGTVTHFPANVHLTPHGQEIVAEGLLSLLREMQIMPAGN